MKYLPFIIIILFSVSSYSQQTENKIMQSLDSFSRGYPQEKVYIHFDRSNYTAGETIWFKAYVTNEGKPGFLSKVLYLELVNQQNKLVDKKMLKLENGTAHGEFLLKDSLLSGNYAINAYTLWMLNFPEFIFSKTLFIYNTDFKKNPSPVNKNISVKFFPEGGQLLVDLQSKIAFKATGPNNLPVPVTGSVVSSKNMEVARFSSFHDGMGTFDLKPAGNEQYTAIINFEDGTKKDFSLPPAKNEGILLKTDNHQPNKVFVSVERADANKNNYNELLIVAQVNNEIVYLNKLNIDEGLDAAAIPKKDLPPGIMLITIMDKAGKPLAERLVFPGNIPRQADLLQTTTVHADAEQINEYSLDLAAYKKPEISVSVTDFSADEGSVGENILSSVLLTSDLADYVHNPGFYFKDTSLATRQALDVLLMTEKWQRSDWNLLMKNEFPKLRYPVESGISISGTLTKADGKKSINGKINLWIKGEDSTTIVSEATVNAKDQFYIPDLDFKKSATIYYQGTNLQKENALVNIRIDPSFFDTLKMPHQKPIVDLDPNHSNENVNSYIENLLKQKQKEMDAEGKVLTEVIVKTKKRSVTDSLNQVYASTIFYNSDQTLVMDSTASYFDMFQYLIRNVPGITINKTDTGTQVIFNRYAGAGFFSDNEASSVQFFLNEVPVSVDIISTLNPYDVGLVKIYKGATGIALGAVRGAIAIYTIKGRSTKDWRLKGFDSFKRQGYSVTREFFNPGHSKTDSLSLPPRGATLFWEPVTRIKSDQKVLISFYNVVVAKKIRVTIEGLDKNGNLLHIEKIVE